MKKVIVGIISVCLALILALLPTKAMLEAKTIDGLKFDAKAYCLMDFNTGTMLASENSTEKLEVASMVKLMTSLLVMEKLDRNEWALTDTLRTSEYAASMEGSQAFLDAGADYTIDNLLKSVIIASANDSSVVLAEGYAGNEQSFVSLMNSRAKELGMNNTLYANATGLPALTQYSTAEDIAIILKEVSKHEMYHKYSTIWLDKLVHDSGRETELVNTNRLVKYFPGCDCGKTGFTDEAGYCLSASAERNGMRLISVVMGAKSSAERFTISTNLLNYGFANYKNEKVADCTKNVLTNSKVKGTKSNIEVRLERDMFALTKNGDPEKHNYETKIDITVNLKNPIFANDNIGKAYLLKDNVVIDEVNVFATNDYIKPNYIQIVRNIGTNWAI